MSEQNLQKNIEIPVKVNVSSFAKELFFKYINSEHHKNERSRPTAEHINNRVLKSDNENRLIEKNNNGMNKLILMHTFNNHLPSET